MNSSNLSVLMSILLNYYETGRRYIAQVADMALSTNLTN